MNTVVFAGDDTPGFLGVVFHQHPVDRLQGKHVDDRRADALLLQLTRRFQRFRHHNSIGNQGNIGAFAQHIAFADGKRRARRVHARCLLTDGTYPVEAFEVDKLAQHVFKHYRVGDFQHHRVRQTANDTHVFKRHMRSAVVAGRHACI